VSFKGERGKRHTTIAAQRLEHPTTNLENTAMIGLRLWLSLLFMCVGSAILSFYQTMLGNYESDLVSVDEWMPFENEGRGENMLLRNEKKKARAFTGNGADLFDFREPKDGSIKSIALLGERNSGTRWIYGHLGMCFNHTIPVSPITF
jgi:hypothetical protein